jgi:hypothetical protein
MDEVARLLNEMVRAGVIVDYAVFGAVAQMRYTEAVTTLDADIQALLTKQAAWQRSRAARPWAEKLRSSVAMRSAVTSMRSATAQPPGPPTRISR